MTRTLRELIAEGYPITQEVLARLSPYGTEHITRFGKHQLQLDPLPPRVTDLDLGPRDEPC